MNKDRTPTLPVASKEPSKPLLDTVPNSTTIAAMRFLKSILITFTVASVHPQLQAAAPVLTASPTVTVQSVITGTNLTFTAKATGATSVKWVYSKLSTSTGAADFSVRSDFTAATEFNNETGFDTLTGNDATLTLTTATVLESGYHIRAEFTNADGTTNSSSAKVIVTASNPTAPTVTTNPNSASIVAGNSVSFFASATGVPDPTIQWQRSTDGGTTFSAITDSRFSGTTGNTLSFTATTADNGTRYRAAFTNLTGTTSNTVNSSSATLTVTNSTTPTPETPQGTNTQGVLVYNLNFKHLAGFGIDFFEDGYVVLPATGGAGEVLFLGRDSGKRIYSKQTGVKSFVGKTREETYTVVTMNGTSGASLCMHAYGKADDKVKANTPTVSISVKTARTLHGIAQAAYDESTATTKPTNGTLGFVEFSEMKLVLDEGETSRVNDNSLSVVDAMKTLVTKVTARGYSELKLTTATTTTTTTGNSTSTSTDSTTDSTSSTTTTK